MKIGQNIFSVLVTDISGSAIPGLSGSDFTLQGQIDESELTIIDDIRPTVSDGIYQAVVNLPIAGQGHLEFTPTNPDFFIAPDFFNISVTNNDIDDVYRVTNFRFIDIGTQSSDQTYRNVRISSKAGDDIIFDVVTQEDITGFTDWKSEFVLSTTESPSGTNYIGEASVESIDVSTGTIQLKLPFSLTVGIVPVGLSELRIYGDLQARDPSGNRKTISDIIIRLRREFTTG